MSFQLENHELVTHQKRMIRFSTLIEFKLLKMKKSYNRQINSIQARSSLRLNAYSNMPVQKFFLSKHIYIIDIEFTVECLFFYFYSLNNSTSQHLMVINDVCSNEMHRSCSGAHQKNSNNSYQLNLLMLSFVGTTKMSHRS